MAEFEASELITQLEGTYLVIEELNSAIPRIKEDIKDNIRLSEEIKRLSTKAESALGEVGRSGEKINAEVQDAFIKIQASVDTVENIQKSVTEKIESLPNIERLKSDIDELVGHVKVLDKKIKAIEKKLSQVFYDADKLYSIEELLNFVDMDELIVVRNKWHGDFCFKVKTIDNGFAEGTEYRDGAKYRDIKFGIHDEEFRLYDGPSRELILAMA